MSVTTDGQVAIPQRIREKRGITPATEVDFVGFDKIEALASALGEAGFRMLEIPREALFLTGKAYLSYSGRKENRRSPLPDFDTGAPAAVLGLPLVTRDIRRYRTDFPTVEPICPTPA